jgi:hypothetical protein
MALADEFDADEKRAFLLESFGVVKLHD